MSKLKALDWKYWIGLLVAVLSCVASWLALAPQIQSPATPTPMPTRRTFDVYDDFNASQLGPTWNEIQGDLSPVVRDGALRMTCTSTGASGGGGLHANIADRRLRLIAAELVVADAAPQSYVYVQVHLGMIDGQPWYANFGVMDTGELFYASAPVGQGPSGVEQTWSGNGLGNPNVLAIEWAGDDVRFSANDQLLHTVQAEDGGWWAILSTGFTGGGRCIGAFNWAGWSYGR